MIDFKNKKVLKSIISPLLSGIVLAALGIGLIYLVPGKRASADTSRTTFNQTWAANKLLAISYRDARGTYKLPFGVAGWEVSGNLKDQSNNVTQTYLENWKTDDLGSLCIAQLPSYSNNKRWLYGFNVTSAMADPSMPSCSAIRFILENYSKSYTNNQRGNAPAGNAIVGSSVMCTGAGCSTATGAYGFNLAVGGNPSNIAGMMLPLYWTVSGTVCDSPSDANCQGDPNLAL
jgi:hypothetical protein